MTPIVGLLSEVCPLRSGEFSMFRNATLGSVEYGVLPASELTPSMDESAIGIGENLDSALCILVMGDANAPLDCSRLCGMIPLRTVGLCCMLALSSAYFCHPWYVDPLC